MNNSAKIDAFHSFYNQANNLLKSNDYYNARSLFIKAASLANEISLESTSNDVKMEYHYLAIKILNFVKNDCKNKTVEVNASKKEKNAFQPIEQNSNDKITFNDVAGLQDVKNEIIFNVIEPLNNPKLAESYNIKPGAKILLYGPPGTGKTFIARAIAGEVDATFYSVNCQDLISKYMGESSKQINMLFEEAQKNKRAIIFFDEFDSLASKRENDGSNAIDGEISRFVASFLTKVDGFKKPKDCEMLLLIAATNRPWAIDSAMLRGGRFDIQIYVGLPDANSRLFLINKELQNMGLTNSDFAYLVDKLNGYGGADIVATCRKIKQLAYRRAIQTNKFETVIRKDIDEILNCLKPSLSEYDLEQFERFKKGEI